MSGYKRRPRADPHRRTAGRCKSGRSRNFFSALSRDVGTVRVHRASDALRRYESGTGLSSGITSAAPGIILVIAALSLIHCQTFGGNDYERLALGANSAWRCRCMKISYSLWQTVRVTKCHKLSGLFGVCSVSEELL